MIYEPLSDQLIWQEILTQASLKEILYVKLKRSKAKGIDRLNIDQFFNQSKQHIEHIQSKCLQGNYRFSPYLENLKSKGKNKNPRVISIPTVRDRIVLLVLKELLFKIFPECIPKKLSNTYIHEIKSLIPELELASTNIFRTDIRNFYPSIIREILFKKISKRITSEAIINLLTRAIENPTVPKNYRKKDKKNYYESKGIPQGLSISNILASIYINDIDKKFRDIDNIKYYRYVDDILIISPETKIDQYNHLLRKECKNIGFDLNEDEDKTFQGKATDKFNYLGYSFNLPNITIKQSSVDRFIDSIVSKFSNYQHNKQKFLKKHKYLTNDKIKEIFIFELNEKITGAISYNKRYGWVLYYNAVNDISIFYKLDKLIESFFNRLEDFNGKAPQNLKKLSKAHHQGKYNLHGGYIHNYNKYKTREEKIDFLSNIGKIDPNRDYSEEDINKMYELYKNISLAKLEKDDANIY
ncbi:MAG: reverse transcriptase domain-containing protein [Crocosphaera sp.]|nr:reverse transcriptase domain-containing protein [Crocosphaera sp.]